MEDLGLSEKQIEDEISRAIKLLNEILAFFFRIETGNNNCGYFVILDGKSGEPLLMREIGECPQKKAGQYLARALRNAKLLFGNQIPRELGAIWVRGPAIVSFNGLSSPRINSIVMLYFAYKTKLLSKDGVLSLGREYGALMKHLFLFGKD